MLNTNERIIIAGPCSAESREQVINCAIALKKRGIGIMRASLWKPRTKPGFEGVGIKGTAWLAEVTQLGLTAGTEILVADQVTKFINGIKKNKGDITKLLFWLGSRNQNHVVQRDIAKRILKEAPINTKLLIKHQPWEDERHWLGIVDHVLSSGFPVERLILCHRGFSPKGSPNPKKYRNIPNFAEAMRVRQLTSIPMVLDPSHIGGTVDNVFEVIREARGMDFDGIMVEVHPTPDTALSDAKQQLTIDRFDRLLKMVS